MPKFICEIDEQENTRQGMADFEEMFNSVKDEESRKWLEEHKDLYFTEEN